MQRNWIGKSTGCAVRFPLSPFSSSVAADQEDLRNIEIFTTRVDTLFGVSYVAVALDHPIVEATLQHLKSRSPAEFQALQAFLDFERGRDVSVEEDGTTVGMRLPLAVVHPLTKEEVSVMQL